MGRLEKNSLATMYLLFNTKGKVKCTVVQALRLCTGRTVHRGSRGIALFFLDHSTRRALRGQQDAPAALYPGKHSVPIVHGAGWAPGPVWTGGEKPAHTGIRSKDCPARSQSLYRLSYRAHLNTEPECQSSDLEFIPHQFDW